MVDNDVEKRKDKRLDLVLPIEFFFHACDASFAPRSGQTRNVSSGGVYFETEGECDVAIDAELMMRIAVPTRRETGGQPMTLQGKGKVLRVESLRDADQPEGASSRWGVAVEFSNKPTVRLFSLMEYLTGNE